MEAESLLPSNIELAKLISKTGDRLLLGVSGLLGIASIGVPRLLWLLSIVSTLRLLLLLLLQLLLLLLLLELVLSSQTGGEQLGGRPAGCIPSCSRIRGAVVSLSLSGSILSTFRVLWLGSSRGQIIDWNGWSKLWRLPLRMARRGF